MRKSQRLSILLLIVFLTIMHGMGCDFWGGRRRGGGNEGAGISALRTISSAEELYNTRYERYGTFEELDRADMIDSVLAGATSAASPKSGYYFILTVSKTGLSWTCITRPSDWGITGERNFKIDQTGVIYFNTIENSSEWVKSLGG